MMSQRAKLGKLPCPYNMALCPTSDKPCGVPPDGSRTRTSGYGAPHLPAAMRHAAAPVDHGRTRLFPRLLFASACSLLGTTGLKPQRTARRPERLSKEKG